MPLLNYTTQVPAEKSVAEIQRTLAAHGALRVAVGYEAGVPSAVAFTVATSVGDRPFRRPARVAAVAATLAAQRKHGKVPPRLATRDQAARVAWRILKDWVEAQMAIIESGMVSIEEVMLPYMLDGRDRTCFEVMRERHLALPGPREAR